MQWRYKKGIRNGYARLEGEDIVLTIPFSMKDNSDFLDKMKVLGEKLQKKIEKRSQNQIFSDDSVLLFGEQVALNELPPYKNIKERSRFFQQELFEYANPLLQTLAHQLGFENIPLSIRKVKSKWGSCTYDNRIMLNQNLVHLPTKMIQYVIVHEACHLKEKNHGPHFWALVEKYFPSFKLVRKNLKNQIIV